MKTLRNIIIPSFYLNILNIYSVLSILLGILIEFTVSEKKKQKRNHCNYDKKYEKEILGARKAQIRKLNLL